MTGHRGIASKIKPLLFIPLFNRANDRVNRVNNCSIEPTSVSMVYHMEIEIIEVFQNIHLVGTDQKFCSF